MPSPDEFMECDTCRAKPGSPPLCAGCLHNRQAIDKLRGAMQIMKAVLDTFRRLVPDGKSKLA